MKVVFPVRGLTAVFLFIMGLAAAVMARGCRARALCGGPEPGAMAAADGEIAAFVF